jgi:hypothetical protein
MHVGCCSLPEVGLCFVSVDVLASVAEVLQSDRVVVGWNGLNAR